jgi:hypothetical protein
MSLLRRFALCGCTAALLLSLVSRAPAQAPADPAAEPVEPPIPLVVMTIGSIDKSLSDIFWMFDSVKRSDMKDVIGGFLKQAGDLKGIDRKRPFGQIIFLQTDVLPPRPSFVGFVPIENIDEALKTLALAPVKPRKALGRDDLYEVLEGDGDNVEMVIRVVDGYAYITGDEWRDTLENLPDLPAVFEPLAARYDAGVTLRIKAVPEGVRTVFVAFLRTQAEIELQRKDEEPEAAYLVRRANGISMVEFLDQFLMQGEDVTLGWNAQPDQKKGIIEFSMNATPDSEFAKYLSDVASKPSMFAALRNEQAPLTINVSWVMNKREIDATKLILDAMKSELKKILPDVANEGGAIDQMFKVLHATTDAGHFDFFLQFAAPDVRQFVILGGLKLVGGQAFGTALAQVMDSVIVNQQKHIAAGTARDADDAEITARAESHQGISFHKIAPRQTDRESERFFGGAPEFLFGASSRVLWFSIGAEDALPTLRDAIDTVAASPPASREPGGNVPFQLTARVAPWLELPPPEKPEPAAVGEGNDENTPRVEEWRQRQYDRQMQRRATAEEAFNDTDSIRVDAKPSESGIRFRITLDEGFVKLLGLVISREYDKSQL